MANALVAHRCIEHQGLAPLNPDASILVVYVPEYRPTAYPLLEVEGSRVTAECGGCLAEQVEGLYQINLDLLDLLADLLLSRAELRSELAMRKKLLV